MTDMTTRACSKCGETKPLSEFHRRANGDGRDGRHSHCKVCKNAAMRLLRPMRYCVDCHVELPRGDKHVRCGLCREKAARAQRREEKARAAAGPKAKRQNECKTCDFLADCRALLPGTALPYCFPESQYHNVYRVHLGKGRKIKPLTAEFLLTLEAV